MFPLELNIDRVGLAERPEAADRAQRRLDPGPPRATRTRRSITSAGPAYAKSTVRYTRSSDPWCNVRGGGPGGRGQVRPACARSRQPGAAARADRRGRQPRPVGGRHRLSRHGAAGRRPVRRAFRFRYLRPRRVHQASRRRRGRDAVVAVDADGNLVAPASAGRPRLRRAAATSSWDHLQVARTIDLRGRRTPPGIAVGVGDGTPVSAGDRSPPSRPDGAGHALVVRDPGRCRGAGTRPRRPVDDHRAVPADRHRLRRRRARQRGHGRRSTGRAARSGRDGWRWSPTVPRRSPESRSARSTSTASSS